MAGTLDAAACIQRVLTVSSSSSSSVPLGLVVAATIVLALYSRLHVKTERKQEWFIFGMISNCARAFGVERADQSIVQAAVHALSAPGQHQQERQGASAVKEKEMQEALVDVATGQARFGGSDVIQMITRREKCLLCEQPLPGPAELEKSRGDRSSPSIGLRVITNRPGRCSQVTAKLYPQTCVNCPSAPFRYPEDHFPELVQKVTQARRECFQERKRNQAVEIAESALLKARGRCNVHHYTSHAEVVMPDASQKGKPVIVESHLYFDFDDPTGGRFFPATKETWIDTSLLVEASVMMYIHAVSGEAICDTFNRRLSNTFADEQAPELFSEKLLHRSVEKFNIAQMLRDSSSRPRDEFRRNFGPPLSHGRGGYYDGDRAFELQNAWPYLNSNNLDAYLEEHTKPAGKFDKLLGKWVQHKCLHADGKWCSSGCTMDGDTKLHRQICRYCWRIRAKGSQYCAEIGKDGHEQEPHSGIRVTPETASGLPTSTSAPAGFYTHTQSESAKLRAAAQPGHGWANQGAAGGDCGCDDSDTDFDDMRGTSRREADEMKALEKENKFLIGKILSEEVGPDKKRWVWVKWFGYPESDSTLEPLSSLSPSIRAMWDSRPHKNPGRNGQFDTALYVKDPPPGLFGRVSSRSGSARRSLNLFDESEFMSDEQSSMYRGDSKDSVPCSTDKDVIERLLNTAGIFLAVSFCGVILQARELYRSEGKQQVALFLMDLLYAYFETGVLLPIAICYDDMCHLLARLLSLMGGNWLAACAVCLVLSLDGFHMVNHVATFCLSSLNPKKFLQVADQNTQSCEQTNRMANKHRSSVLQKPGGSFRFYVLRMCDLHNALLVRRVRRNASDYVPPKERDYDPTYKAKKMKHDEAVKKADRANIKPHLPAEYLGDNKKGTCASHIDVKLFKKAWDEGLKDDPKVMESREKGARLEPEKKHQLRFELARAAVDKGAVIMKDFLRATSAIKKHGSK